MSEDKKDDAPLGAVDIIEHDFGLEIRPHGPDCPRTKEIYEAQRRGEMPPHPDDRRAERCGPPNVTSEAYRRGWDSINWGGKQKEIGQA